MGNYAALQAEIVKPQYAALSDQQIVAMLKSKVVRGRWFRKTAYLSTLGFNPVYFHSAMLVQARRGGL